MKDLINTQQVLSEVVIYNKYAKYTPEFLRRETWPEITMRYLDMQAKRYPMLKEAIYDNGRYILEKKVLPSMRALQFAGPAMEKNEARGYNCSYMPMDDYRAFGELMFLLLGGTGAGYSVQRHHVAALPPITKPTKEAKFLVGDSIEGWADAVKQLMKAYFGLTSVKPRFDLSDIREKGSMLVTAGGKAPGPEPLRMALESIEKILNSKEEGEQLTPFEVHLICCLIADAVLAGGIRRAALIALFSLEDEEMLNAKSSSIPAKLISKEFVTFTSAAGLETDPNRMLITLELNGVIKKDIEIRKSDGEFWDLQQLETTGTVGWWVCHPELGRANNSAVLLRDRIKKEEFDVLWQKIEDSNSGEPGIYFTNDPEYGTNPCCEISLRPFTFCNLTEINAGTIGDDWKAEYSVDYKKAKQDDLENRARVAGFFGTLQAGITDFHYLRSKWKTNTEKDALIGVGITGIGDGKLVDLDLEEATKIVIDENERVADIIGINTAARTSTIKPAGTTSCVLQTGSGCHAWHAPKYIRNIQCKVGDDLYNFFMDHHPLLITPMERDPRSAVIGIPQIAPKGAILREEESALDFLARIKDLNINWVHPGHRRGPNTNNVSATVSIKEGEWKDVGEWMWENKNTYNGLSVLPFNGGTYKNAPFEIVSDEVFQEKLDYIQNNVIDLTLIVEHQDNTTVSDTVACAGGACEII